MEFLSTHPSDARRAADLAALVPDAQKLYDAAPEKFELGANIDPAPPTPVAVASKPESAPPLPAAAPQPSTTPPGELPPSSPTPAAATVGPAPASAAGAASASPFSNWKLPMLPSIFSKQ